MALTTYVKGRAYDWSHAIGRGAANGTGFNYPQTMCLGNDGDLYVAEMRDYIGCDSLEFITLENLRQAIRLDGECCDACLTGNYPAPTPVALGKSGGRW